MGTSPSGSPAVRPGRRRFAASGRAHGRVLLGFADALSAVECAWSLLDAGYDIVAFARRGRRCVLRSVRGVRVVDVAAPEDDADACAEAIRAVIAREAPVAVLPLDDHALLLCDRVAAVTPPDAAAPVIAGPTGPLAAFALDKRQQLAAAAAAGLLVPPSFIADADDDLPATFPEQAAPATAEADGGSGARVGPGPWMVKPALAVVERGGRLLRPSGRLARTVAEAQEVAAGIDGPVIVQPTVSGIGEGVFGLAATAGTVGWSAHRRVRMMNPRGSGSSACRSIAVEPGLRTVSEAFLGEIARRTGAAWHGLFMIELLRDADGRPYFMELNGRPWGSMALALRRGFAYPAWAVGERLDPLYAPRVPVDPPEVTARHLGRELVHLAAVLRGGRGADADVWPRRWPTVRAVLSVRRGDRWYNWRAGQTRVFLADAYATVAEQLGRR